MAKFSEPTQTSPVVRGTWQNVSLSQSGNGSSREERNDVKHTANIWPLTFLVFLVPPRQILLHCLHYYITAVNSPFTLPIHIQTRGIWNIKSTLVINYELKSKIDWYRFCGVQADFYSRFLFSVMELLNKCPAGSCEHTNTHEIHTPELISCTAPLHPDCDTIFVQWDCCA